MIFSIAKTSDINGFVCVLTENGYSVTFTELYNRYEVSVELEPCEDDF